MDRPTLMVFGTADPTGTADIWRGFVGDLPRGELRLINDAGHTPWWDAPSEVAGHVQQFLDRPA
jgi:pimeloyl-ACP methyl ester carboxylesterase